MKKDIVILHGALGSAKQFDEISSVLSQTFNVHIHEFPGHGKRVDEEGEFTIENFAKDLQLFLDSFGHPIVVFGYSMGGYVSIYLAQQHPELFERIVTLGTKFHWNVEEAIKETAMLNVEIMEQKIPKYCDYLKSLHGENWKIVVENTKHLMRSLGNKPLLDHDYCLKIETKIVLMLGSLDKMVTLEETKFMTEKLSNSTHQVIDGFPHPINKVNAMQLAEYLVGFINGNE